MKKILLSLLYLVMYIFSTFVPANAKVYFVSSVETGKFIRNGDQTSGTNHENGQYPFIGKAGLEYDLQPEVTIFIHYMHRSNIDLDRREYWYDSVNMGARFTHCVWLC